MIVSEQSGKAYPELPIEQVKLISQGLGKLIKIAVKSPWNKITRAEGEAIATLVEALGSKPEYVAMDYFGIDDVMGEAKEHKIKLTKTEAREVLKSMEHEVDAMLGMSWTTVRCAIDRVKEGK